MTETCSAVLRSRRNCSSDGAERTDDGRAFNARAAVTGKAPWLHIILTAAGRQNADGSSRVVAAAAGAETVWGGG